MIFRGDTDEDDINSRHCFKCRPRRVMDLSDPLAPLILYKQGGHIAEHDYTAKDTCNTCGEINYIKVMPCVICDRGLCVDCSNWIDNEAAICATCTERHRNSMLNFTLHRLETNDLFACWLQTETPPRHLCCLYTSSIALDALDAYETRKGWWTQRNREWSWSYQLLFMAWQVAQFLPIWPATFFTSTERNKCDGGLYFGFSMEDRGPRAMLFRPTFSGRNAGHLVQLWAVVSAIWWTFAHNHSVRTSMTEMLQRLRSEGNFLHRLRIPGGADHFIMEEHRNIYRLRFRREPTMDSEVNLVDNEDETQPGHMPESEADE